MKREYRDHQGREWFALHVRTGEERDVALAVYGLGDADSLLRALSARAVSALTAAASALPAPSATAISA